jgi:hypothetical protein
LPKAVGKYRKRPQARHEKRKVRHEKQVMRDLQCVYWRWNLARGPWHVATAWKRHTASSDAKPMPRSAIALAEW